jgi:hypothetical protein
VQQSIDRLSAVLDSVKKEKAEKAKQTAFLLADEFPPGAPPLPNILATPEGAADLERETERERQRQLQEDQQTDFGGLTLSGEPKKRDAVSPPPQASSPLSSGDENPEPHSPLKVDPHGDLLLRKGPSRDAAVDDDSQTLFAGWSSDSSEFTFSF